VLQRPADAREEISTGAHTFENAFVGGGGGGTVEAGAACVAFRKYLEVDDPGAIKRAPRASPPERDAAVIRAACTVAVSVETGEITRGGAVGGYSG